MGASLQSMLLPMLKASVYLPCSRDCKQRDPVTMSFVLIIWSWLLHSYSTTVWRHKLVTSTDAVHKHEHFCTELFFQKKRKEKSRPNLFCSASGYRAEDAQELWWLGSSTSELKCWQAELLLSHTASSYPSATLCLLQKMKSPLSLTAN